MTTAATLFVLWQLFPSKILRDTTPGYSDLTAHFNTAWQLHHDLLPRGRLSGWAMGWSTGFPVLTFYFPLGSLVVAFLGWLVPLNVAMKLVATAGPLTLPLAAYTFGRLNGRSRPASAGLGVAVLPMLLEPSLYLPGGSIVAAVGIGEYGYSLALSLALLALGVAGAGLRTGRHRLLTACLLAATVLFHVLPAMFAFAGTVVLVALGPSRARIRWALSVIVPAVGLTGFWLVPFLARQRFTGGYECEKAGGVASWLFPAGMAPVAGVAGVGLVIGVLAVAAGHRRADRLRSFMAIMAGLGALAFVVAPSGQVCNTRFLSMWFLWLCLLAGDALGRLAEALDDSRRSAARGRPVASPDLARLSMPVALLVAVLVAWESRGLPGLLFEARPGTATLLESPMAGFETGPGHRQFRGLADTLRAVGREHGCGRAFWEHTENVVLGIVPYQAFMTLVPRLTNGCIQVGRGVYGESTATGAYLDFTNQRLSASPVVLSKERRTKDMASGVADLRILGMRYFVTADPRTDEAAGRSPELRLVGEAGQGGRRAWKVYEVQPTVELVEPLRYAPVVVPGSGSRLGWQRLASTWYDGAARDVLVAADGPSEWPHRARLTPDLPRQPAAPATVSAVRVGDDRVSFRVSRTGVPVLVKVSYFPNWQASGADGPWRVGPNQMVVVPTSPTVTLRYGRTAVEHAGLLVTLAGVAGLVFTARQGPVGMPEKEPTPTSPEGPTRAHVGAKRRKPPGKKKRHRRP